MHDQPQKPLRGEELSKLYAIPKTQDERRADEVARETARHARRPKLVPVRVALYLSAAMSAVLMLPSVVFALVHGGMGGIFFSFLVVGVVAVGWIGAIKSVNELYTPTVNGARSFFFTYNTLMLLGIVILGLTYNLFGRVLNEPISTITTLLPFHAVACVFISMMTYRDDIYRKSLERPQ